MTEYWENRVLDSVFHGVDFEISTAYVGLATQNGAMTYELTHSDYSRKLIEWNVVAGGAITNSNQIMWSPTTNWGTIPVAFIADTAQGGTMVLIGSLGVNSGAGSKIVIEPGALSVT